MADTTPSSQPTTPRTGQGDHAAGLDNGPLSPAGVKALKIAIAVMGVMIVGGVLLIIGRIFYMASQPKSAAHVISTGKLAPSHHIGLPDGAVIMETTLSGDRLVVRYSNQPGNTAASPGGVMIYDLANGRKLSHVIFGKANMADAPGKVPAGR